MAKEKMLPENDYTPVTYDPQYILMVNHLKKYFPIKGGLLSQTVGHVKAVDGVTVSRYTPRTARTGWGSWSPKVTYPVLTYTATAPAQSTDYTVCAVNAEGTASEPITATLTVRPATWWNWWF